MNSAPPRPRQPTADDFVTWFVLERCQKRQFPPQSLCSNILSSETKMSIKAWLCVSILTFATQCSRLVRFNGRSVHSYWPFANSAWPRLACSSSPCASCVRACSTCGSRACNPWWVLPLLSTAPTRFKEVRYPHYTSGVRRFGVVAASLVWAQWQPTRAVPRVGVCANAGIAPMGSVVAWSSEIKMKLRWGK